MKIVLYDLNLLIVCRSQAQQLLGKFHKWRVFEDVRGSKYDRETFTDNGRLFRFPPPNPDSPALGKQTSASARPPLATQTALMNGIKFDPLEDDVTTQCTSLATSGTAAVSFRNMSLFK